MLALIPLIHAKDPTMGARQLGIVLGRNDYHASRWTTGKMMEHLGIKAIYCSPCTTQAAPENPKYPYFWLSVRLAGSEAVPATGSEPGQEIVTS
ncbi:MAG: hypothetical protein GWQ05_29010 [Verrucomicrobiaceae bacterium]|nr:hypothetical protein [Verrucomicrobiaceae bacterium]